MLYRVPPDIAKGRNRTLRVGIWAVLALCAAILAVSYSGDLGLNVSRALAGITGVLLLVVVAAAQVWSFREGVRRHKSSIELELLGNLLVQRKEGWPDTEVRLSEISSVYEDRGWLTVRSGNKGIAIPVEISGFQDLKANLLQGRQLTLPPRDVAPAVVRIVVLIAGWALLLLSSRPTLVVAAAVGVLALQTWGAVQIARKLRPGPKLPFAFFVATSLLGSSIVLWLLYSRLATLNLGT